MGIFVCGTDTGVGKTTVCRLLKRYLREMGFKAVKQKWIETGTNKKSSDTLPYVFKYPSSPHLAARLEDKKINAGKIIRSFRRLEKRFDFVVVEGTGGVLVPYSNKGLIIDIVRKLELPVLIVAQNKLGAINHTLLTIEALKKRKIMILGVVFNNLGRERKIIIKDNPLIIKMLTKERFFGILPKTLSFDSLYKKFIPIARQIYESVA